MPLFITDAARAIGVSPATLKRWLRSARVQDVPRDRNGYRVFESEDIARLRAYANQRFEPSPRFERHAAERSMAMS
jgi:DNA-binding transcriptional MerR regulator